MNIPSNRDNIKNDKKMMSRLKKKVNGYNNQDKKKGRLVFNPKYDCTIPKELTIDEVVELIHEKGLSCSYCYDVVYIIPNAKNKNNQLTLDRIDNSKSHTISNCVISCLDCNLTRSDFVSSERFKEIKNK